MTQSERHKETQRDTNAKKGETKTPRLTKTQRQRERERERERESLRDT